MGTNYEKPFISSDLSTLHELRASGLDSRIINTFSSFSTDSRTDHGQADWAAHTADHAADDVTTSPTLDPTSPSAYSTSDFSFSHSASEQNLSHAAFRPA